MSTEAQLKAISNSELASGNQIPALKHRTVNNAIIEEMYDAQSRGDILAGVQTAVSIASGDQVLVIRSGQAYLLDSTEFGFVDALADLTDVSIPAPANDQVLAYNTATSKWEAKDVNNLANVVSISGSATTNTLTKFTGTSSIGDSIISDNGSTVTIAGDLSVNNDLTVGTINSGTSSDFVKGDGSLDSTTYQDTSEKSQANGYAALDSGAKIPLANLPDSILGQVTYQGTWAASTNTPTLANPPASTTKGEYYVASDDGTQFGIDFQVGDWIISNGTAWEKVDNTDAVTSVFGRLGNVVANAGDYDAFYVNLDGTQTITGDKTFDNDLTVNGSLDVTSDLAVDTDTLFVDSINNSVLIGTSVDNGTGESLQVTGNALIKKSGDVVINIQSDAADALEFTGSINFFADNGSDFLGVLGYQSVGGSDMKLQNSRGSLVLVSVADDVVLFPGSGGSVRVINGDFKVNTDTLFVDVSTNQVGIGTDNPSAKLDVVGDAEINGTLDVTGVISGDGSGLTNLDYNNISNPPTLPTDFVSKANGGTFGGDITINANLGVGGNPLASSISGSYQSVSIIDSNVSSLILDHSVAKRFEIASVGNNGGELWFRSGDDNVNAIIIDNSNNTRITGNLAVDTDTLFVDASNDTVGINTTPLSTFQGILEIGDSGGFLHGGGLTWSSGNFLYMSNNAYYTDNFRAKRTNPAAFIIMRDNEVVFERAESTTAGNVISFSESMRIDSSGNVGIGTEDGDVYDRFYTRSVGISSSGTTSLQIRGTTFGGLDMGDSTRNFSITSNSTLTQIGTVTNTPLNFFINGSTKMRIDSSGNVGINTENPTAKLHVTGDVRASGDAIFGGIISTNNGTNEWELRRAVNEFGLTLFTDRYIWVTIDGVNYALALYSNATFPS